MKNLPVTSKIIKAVYFDQSDGKLRICFKNGEERLFTGVSETDAKAMVTAPSPGQHYIENVRNCFRRVA